MQSTSTEDASRIFNIFKPAGENDNRRPCEHISIKLSERSAIGQEGVRCLWRGSEPGAESDFKRVSQYCYE